MKIVWYGTASLLIEEGNDRILFDPFVALKGGENPTSLENFIKEKSIFITHGHFDHLYNIKEIAAIGNAEIHCSSVPAKTLKKCGVGMNCINVIKPYDSCQKGEIQVIALKGKHIRFDSELIFSTLFNLRILKHFSNFLFMLKTNLHFPEGNETTAYKVEARGKKILIMGSLNYDQEETYPTDIDLLVMPFQGKSNLIGPALEIVDMIMPKKILLIHFDDAFPPISRTVDTNPFIKVMADKYSKIQVIKPKAGESIEL